MLRYYPWDYSPSPKRVLIPKLPTPVHEVEYECGECGMVFKGAMGYVCPNVRCPVFPVITCGTENEVKYTHEPIPCGLRFEDM